MDQLVGIIILINIILLLVIMCYQELGLMVLVCLTLQ